MSETDIRVTPSHPAPDLLRNDDDSAIRTAAAWRTRRDQLLATLLDIEYGNLPPAPGPGIVPGNGRVEIETLHFHDVARFGDVRHRQWRVTARFAGGNVSFLFDVLHPKGYGLWPVVLAGDGCWKYVSDRVTEAVLARGFALAQFNRVEIAPDRSEHPRRAAIYDLHPGAMFGALAAWAWGYHRCVDAIEQIDSLDARRVAIIGHSRGGKAVLLAAATDERIAAAAVNNSGCGGAGSFKVRAGDCERVSHAMGAFPYWYGPKLRDFVDREEALPFDQHVLLAAVAPRAVITLEAGDDAWANPVGTGAVHAAARPVFDLLGVPDRLALHTRPGAHAHAYEDWLASLDFFDRCLGAPKERE